LKRWIAGLVTATLIVIVLVIARRRGPLPANPSAGATPEACIERMFEAARQGDVETYLNCFTGSERDRLDRELGDQPRTAFARSLVEAVESLKGRAVFEGKTDGDPESNRALTVDRVYLNRTERQTYQLVRESGAWRIHTVQTATPFQPDKPYGTPVYEPPPDEETPGQ
jgi:hypothetical protein